MASLKQVLTEQFGYPQSDVLIKEYKKELVKILEEEGPEGAIQWFTNEVGLEIEYMIDLLV